jgi:hypothetical protein
MTEEFLYYIWKYSLFEKNNLIADTGDKIEILKPGERNTNSGPDFLNVSIKIGSTKWAGNLEIHINSSDWSKHKHNEDKAYDNVILHAVLINDQVTKRTNGEIIPTLELKFNKYLYNNYSRLISNEQWIPCQIEIKKVDEFYIDYWLNVLLADRLELKASSIYNTLKVTMNDWEETFYIHLARNFGFNLNSVPFEMLAKSLPIKYLSKHKNNLYQIEALLFGQAGFLNDNILFDSYYEKLRREYFYLRKKLQLNPLDRHIWKFLRLRPGNFPTVRIAQFAVLIYNTSGLFSKIIDCRSIEQLYQYFSVNPSEYWRDHYLFGKKSKFKIKKLGESAFNIIFMNTIVPFLFIYGKYYGKDDLKERAVDFLTKIPAENNNIIKKWGKLGIIAKNAFYSQALLQLKNEYCNKRNCLNCQIGNKIITSTE